MKLSQKEKYLEVGTNGKGEMILIFKKQDMEVDANGVGHIVFSPAEARQFGNVIMKQADAAYHEWWKNKCRAALRAAKGER